MHRNYDGKVIREFFLIVYNAATLNKTAHFVIDLAS